MLFGAWFDITCAGSGSARQRDVCRQRPGPLHHAERQLPGRASSAPSRSSRTRCHDQDLDDGGPNTDTLPANYVWSFTVSTGTRAAVTRRASI